MKRTAVDIQKELIQKIIDNTMLKISDGQIENTVPIKTIWLTVTGNHFLSKGDYIRIINDNNFKDKYKITSAGKIFIKFRVPSEDITPAMVEALRDKDLIIANHIDNNLEKTFDRDQYPVCIIVPANRNSYPNAANLYLPGEVEFIVMTMHAIPEGTGGSKYTDNIQDTMDEAEINFTNIMSILNCKLSADPVFKNTIWGKIRVVSIAATILKE